MLTFAVTVLTGAAAFSPPPVPTDTLPAEPAGAVRSFSDASVATGGGTPLEQAVLLNEQEQKQEQLLSLEAREWFGRAITDSEFLEWFEEDNSGKQGEGTIGTVEVEGESSLERLAEFLEARATTVAESLKAEAENGSYQARVEFLEAKFLEAEEEGEAEEGEGTLEEYEKYLERLAAFIEAEHQEEGEGYSGEEEREGTLEEEGELILGPIESYGERKKEDESYAGDVKAKARVTAVAEFLKAEEEDGSYGARMDEFLEAEEGEAEEGKVKGNEGSFERVDESYWPKVNAFGKEEGKSYDGGGESYDGDVEEKARAAEFLKAYKAAEEGEAEKGEVDEPGESEESESYQLWRYRPSSEEGEGTFEEEGESYGERKEKSYHAAPQDLGKVLLANGEEQPAVVLKPVKAAEEGEADYDYHHYFLKAKEEDEEEQGEVKREAEEGLELVPGVPPTRAF